MVGMGLENDSVYEEDKGSNNELECSGERICKEDSGIPCNICKENSGIHASLLPPQQIQAVHGSPPANASLRSCASLPAGPFSSPESNPFGWRRRKGRLPSSFFPSFFFLQLGGRRCIRKSSKVTKCQKRPSRPLLAKPAIRPSSSRFSGARTTSWTPSAASPSRRTGTSAWGVRRRSM